MHIHTYTLAIVYLSSHCHTARCRMRTATLHSHYSVHDRCVAAKHDNVVLRYPTPTHPATDGDDNIALVPAPFRRFSALTKRGGRTVRSQVACAGNYPGITNEY
jgi:hypothetical protein